ncbi:MAG: hypothetical protein ACRDE5_07740, partial [Ginsengibacter sp.]
MNKSINLAAFAILLFAAGCKDQQFEKAKDGSEYKLIRSGNSTKAVPGNFLELNILAKYKDSVLFSTVENGSPRFIPFDTTSFPPYFREVFEGDSLVIRQSTDSIIKSGQGTPWMQ